MALIHGWHLENLLRFNPYLSMKDKERKVARRSKPIPEKLIQAKAYEIWKARGKGEGNAEADWYAAIELLEQPSRRGGWRKFLSNIVNSPLKYLSKAVVLIPVFAFCFGLYSEDKKDLREQELSRNLNHQRIVEDYINSIREIQYSEDYKAKPKEELQLIRNMTLVALREIELDGERKARITLLLHQLEIPQNYSNIAKFNEFSEEFFKGGDLKSADFLGYPLGDTNLAKADLRGANFRGADLNNSNLSDAVLSCHLYPVSRWWSWIPILEGAFNNNLKDKIPLKIPVIDSLYPQDERCAQLIETRLSRANLTRADLTSADLTSADLTGADLTGADLTDTNLTGADLTDTDLTGVDLTGANLTNAFLRKTNLQDVKWDSITDWECAFYFEGETVFPEDFQPVREMCPIQVGVNLEGKDLRYRDLSQLNLTGADLTGANLTGVDLTGADLTGVDLTGADLTGADLTGADLTEANLDFVIFKDAEIDNKTRLDNKWRLVYQIINSTDDLDIASLTSKDLSSAYLGSADLENTDLSETNLINADLSGVRNLTDSQLTQSKLCNTRLPNNIKINPDRDC